jgi:hypothetical protein
VNGIVVEVPQTMGSPQHHIGGIEAVAQSGTEYGRIAGEQ